MLKDQTNSNIDSITKTQYNDIIEKYIGVGKI